MIRLDRIFAIQKNITYDWKVTFLAVHSREFCRGWDDASSAKIRTATSISSSNPACVQLGGDIRIALDQQHFCIGQSDGKNQADTDFKNHIGLNDNPPTAQDQTKQYSEGYKIGYDDELNILIHG